MDNIAAARSRFALSPATRACFGSSGAVLLSLQRNRFYGLSLTDALILERLLHEGCASDHEPASVRQFLNAGLLVRFDADRPLPLPPPLRLESPLTAVQATQSPSAITALTLMHFAGACAWALWALKYSSLESTARSVRELRLSHAERRVDTTDKVADLISIFGQCRRLTFTARDRCLFHALALTRFLIHHDVPAVWVIGVRLRPWKAHSWAQYGPAVLDSTPEHVHEFLPILIS
ncbi:lasso peptide biosynthesis B2 protein [Povalibacter sp.]|uniref:lasso peptide biosynthesis B2 protein n=1 Tax=Povalibacter sp. TaxID=1962978 RepID=UPI002F3E6892